MVQRFVPEIAAGDKRILVIGGRAGALRLARIPQGSEVRGNLAAGGKGVAQPLTARDREIAEAIGPVLAQRGLLLIGLDVIGDCADRDQRHQPDLLPGDHRADRLRRAGDVHRCAGSCAEDRLGLSPSALPVDEHLEFAGANAVQLSLVVSGAVTTTPPGRSGVVCCAKSIAQVFVGQVRMGERVLPLDVAEVGRAVRPQRLAVGQHEVEGAVRRRCCGASSRSVSVSSSTLGTPACDLASSCMSQQNARSLSVLPTGRKLPCSRGRKSFRSPLWANTQ